jgi:hypothetical protein
MQSSFGRQIITINVASKQKNTAMKNKLIVISMFLVSLSSCSQEGILFKDIFKPNKNYSTKSIKSTVSEIDVEADQETLDKFRNNGYELPMVVQEEINVSANFVTNEMQTNGEFFATVQYGKITFKTSINGKIKEEEKPYSGIKVLGRYNKENEFLVDSIYGVQVSAQTKYQLASEIKSNRMSVQFPEYPLKLNDSFEYKISETTPIQGMNPIRTNIIIKFTLVQIKEGNAYFDITQITNLDSKQEMIKLENDVLGTGKLVYNINEEIITEFITENSIEIIYTLNDKVSMKLKLKSHIIFNKSLF